MLHFVMSYMKQNKRCKQTLETAQYELEINFNTPHLSVINTACPVKHMLETFHWHLTKLANLNLQEMYYYQVIVKLIYSKGKGKLVSNRNAASTMEKQKTQNSSQK